MLNGNNTYDDILNDVTQLGKPIQYNSPQSPNETPCLFSINDFIQDLGNNSQKRNQMSNFHSNNINSYDIANTCIRQTLFRILNYPTISYQDVWLPVLMRSILGNAIHDFIQSNSSSFTEKEVTMKIPSIRSSVRLDCLINHNVLVEIKSCPYSDYGKIINSQTPRDADFYQAIYYRWLLHNYIDEIRSQPRSTLRTDPPKLERYKIDYIQFIYVAHDLISSDSTSISDCIKYASNLKKVLNSKHNKFFNIHTLTINLNNIDMAPYEAYVIEKLSTLNYYLNQNIIPGMDNKFINLNSCFFCLYKETCRRI